jgi:hypothetical protein
MSAEHQRCLECRKDLQEDTKSNPELETHDEATSDHGRDCLGGHDGDGGDLDAHAESHKGTADQKTPPVLREGLGKHGEDTEQTSPEDDSSAAEEIVQGIGRPCAE